MKRAGHLFERLTTFESLLAAYRRARRGTRLNLENTGFTFHLERELLQLRDELLSGVYQPHSYRYFQVHDPKQRTIAVAAFRDRVVHHALVAQLEPLYERCFIHDSYATRKGKGTHTAVFRAQCFLRQNQWFLKTDIEKFFDSVSHDTLLSLLERKVKDPLTLDLAARIIRNGGPHGLGLPIGNLTSQFFANVYLHHFDCFVKQQLQVRHYIRYMDDFVLFHPEKAVLKANLHTIRDYLPEQLGLHLKPGATFINQTDNGLAFLGLRIFPKIIRFQREHWRRIEEKLAYKAYLFDKGKLLEEKLLQSLNSYTAHLGIYHTCGLRRKLLNPEIGPAA